MVSFHVIYIYLYFCFAVFSTAKDYEDYPFKNISLPFEDRVKVSQYMYMYYYTMEMPWKQNGCPYNAMYGTGQ